ncbi:hypothetical protein D3C80_473830 [compost metagenome]
MLNMKFSQILSIPFFLILTSFSFSDDKKEASFSIHAVLLKKDTIPDVKQLIRLWSVHGNPAERTINIRDANLVISMATNQYYITLKEIKRVKNKVYYGYEKMNGPESQDYDSPAYQNDETVCTVELVNRDVLKLSWLGLYDKGLKERFETENPFDQYKKIVLLKRCVDDHR